MRIRWRNFELPSRVHPDAESLTTTYGRFIIEPFEQGFGHTIGNGLRRVLLSSIEGTALANTVKRLQPSQVLTLNEPFYSGFPVVLADVGTRDPHVYTSQFGLSLRLQSAEEAVRPPFLGEFDSGPADVPLGLLEHPLELVEQGHRIRRSAREAGEHLPVVEAAQLHGVVLDDGGAQSDLAVAADRDGAARADGKNGRHESIVSSARGLWQHLAGRWGICHSTPHARRVHRGGRHRRFR
jgi:hypothetical protein